MAGQSDNDDGAQGAAAPEQLLAPLDDVEDEAWEGFALDASVFRSGDGHQN